MDPDLHLVQLVLKGQKTAFQKLVERYQGYVFTIAHRVLRSREDAEEAAQDVFIKVYKTLTTFERKSKFSTWLYTIAYRTALDQARKKRMAVQSMEDENSLDISDEGDQSPVQLIQQADLQQQLKHAIGRLKPVDASIITLFYLHEKSVKEISEITGLTVTNIKTKLHRLRETLKNELTNLLQEEIKDIL